MLDGKSLVDRIESTGHAWPECWSATRQIGSVERRSEDEIASEGQSTSVCRHEDCASDDRDDQCSADTACNTAFNCQQCIHHMRSVAASNGIDHSCLTTNIDMHCDVASADFFYSTATSFV